MSKSVMPSGTQMNNLLSPKQVGLALGLSESSIKRYCDQGVLNSVRTLGGHRRLTLNEVLQFVKNRRQAIVSPSALGLSTRSLGSEIDIESGVVSLFEALLNGNEDSVRQIVNDLYLAGNPISRICDRLICPVFRRIGARWASLAIDVYQERRSCELMQLTLHGLRTMLKEPDQEWIACGGTLEGDHYAIPNTMVELVLREALWNASSLGIAVPCQSMAKALTDMKPKLFWLSVSHIPDDDEFIEQIDHLSHHAEKLKTVFVMGGRALNQAMLRRLPNHSFLICESMQQLETLALQLRRVGTAGPVEEALA